MEVNDKVCDNNMELSNNVNKYSNFVNNVTNCTNCKYYHTYKLVDANFLSRFVSDLLTFRHFQQLQPFGKTNLRP